MSNNQNQESEKGLDEQYKKITLAVELLRFQVKELSQLSYDILTSQPTTVEEWNKFIERYNLIEATNHNKESS